MDDTVRIVPAREEDVPGIMRLMEMVNMHHIPSPEMPELDWRRFFVAWVGGEMAGACGYKMLSDHEGKTTLLAVDPGFRRRGVGNLLQERRMLALIDLGAKSVTTNADRPETISWYKTHFGYKEVGTLAKEHEFGRKDIDHWTTLRSDLEAWQKNRSENKG